MSCSLCWRSRHCQQHLLRRRLRLRGGAPQRNSKADFDWRILSASCLVCRRAGESLCLFYPSANRDEDVFEEPFRFKVDRDPNPHLAFGIGEHFCLGSHVARLELNVMFQQLVARIGDVELAGSVERLRSPFLGGVKHMPVRYGLR